MGRCGVTNIDGNNIFKIWVEGRGEGLVVKIMGK